MLLKYINLDFFVQGLSLAMILFFSGSYIKGLISLSVINEERGMKIFLNVVIICFLLLIICFGKALIDL